MSEDWFHTVTVGTSVGGAAQQVDWSATSLGPPETWPQELRAAVSLCFSTQFPVMVGWGPELTMVFNDGYHAILGTHTAQWALGAPMAKVWAEAWDVVESHIDEVLRTGQSSPSFSSPFRLYRSGFPEEAHFSMSFSPLRDDSGEVRGVMCIGSETTEDVIDRRRLRLLAELNSALKSVTGGVDDIMSVACALLMGRPDIAGADLYIRRGDLVELIASTDIEPSARGVMALRVATTLRSGSSRIRGRTLVAPLSKGRGAEPVGVIVVRASSLRPFDDSYRSFLRLITQTIGAAVVGAVEHRREVDRVRGVSNALQQAMLPAQPGAPGWFTRYRPADGSLAIGGDWYDVVDLGDSRWGLLVGDCVGHGLSAAALMGQLRSAGRALLLEGNSPAATLEGLDRFAATVPGAEFTTVLCGIVDEAAGVFLYSSAGHLPGLVVRPSGPIWLDAGRGFPLALGNEPRTQRIISLGESDVVILYTDGLVERRHEVLSVGLDRLAEVTQQILAINPVEELADELLTELATGAHDDVALVVYSRRQAG